MMFLAYFWANEYDIITLNTWRHLKTKLQQYDTPPKGVHDLWDRVAKEWNEIPPETCHTLIESMPRRIQAVLKAKEGHTKY